MDDETMEMMAQLDELVGKRVHVVNALVHGSGDPQVSWVVAGTLQKDDYYVGDQDMEPTYHCELSEVADAPINFAGCSFMPSHVIELESAPTEGTKYGAYIEIA
ncbi:MAG: hypothetical protein O3B04_10210 [Chloroflexi bacterium]|nr:hypothetical protein [Chloroflexota bacterium]